MSVFVGDGTTGVEARADRLGLPTGTTDPATAEAGDMYYKTDTNTIRVYDGSAWADLASGGGGGGVTEYTIDNSLRFDSASSSYLSRTPSSTGNRRIWTWSAWVKRSQFSTTQGRLFGGGVSGTEYFEIYYPTDDALRVIWYQGAQTLSTTTPLYRDPSAWYHVVLSVDTTQATAADRIKIYVNGVFQPRTGSDPTQNLDTAVNNTVEHDIGRYLTGGGTSYFNGYLADIHFIDGSALAPTAFGEFDATTGVWNPIEYTGSYPGNSFHLDMSTTDVGKDASGNNNDWNISENIATLTGAFSSALTSGQLKTQTAGFTKPYNVGRSEGVGGLTFTPPTPIPYTTSVEVYDNNNVTHSRVNSGSFVQHAPNAWVTVASGSGTINSMFFQRTDNANFDAGFYAIRVDGQVLYDSNQSDYFVDSPTNGTASTGGDPGGSVVGNYATWNPLLSGSAVTLSDGNLAIQSTTGARTATSTIAFDIEVDNFYFELTMITGGSTLGILRVEDAYADLVSFTGGTSGGYAYSTNGQKYNNGTGSAYGASYGNGDVIGVAAGSGQLIFYKNGVSQGVAWSGLTGKFFFSVGAENMNNVANFGQKTFAYQAPAGFVSLNTANIETPSILNGSEYFDVRLDIGNGGTQVRTFGFSPDLIWLKMRSSSGSHHIWDTVRGLGDNELRTNDGPNPEGFNSAYYTISAATNGYQISQDGIGNEVNFSNNTYVTWAWDAGSTTDTNNTAGSIAATGVRANPSAGFSIVTFPGNSVQGATVGHGLNAIPEFVIVKNLDAGTPWDVYHKSTGYGGVLRMNSDAAFVSAGDVFPSSHTSSTIKLGNSNSQNNNGNDMVAYCWTSIPGFSSFGSYVGNGSSNGPVIPLDFSPALIIMKSAVGGTSNWVIIDNRRPGNGNQINHNTLITNSSSGENASGGTTNDFLSNGFKIRGSTDRNTLNVTYVYAAWAQHPFSIARAR